MCIRIVRSVVIIVCGAPTRGNMTFASHGLGQPLAREGDKSRESSESAESTEDGPLASSGTKKLNDSTLGEATNVRFGSRLDRGPVCRDMGGVITVVKTILRQGTANGP